MLKILLATSRPVFWVVGPLAFLTGLKVAGAELTAAAVAQLLLLSMPYCIFLFGINDVYDYKTDLLNKRRGKALLPKYHRKIKAAAAVAAAMLMLSSTATENLGNILLMLSLLLVSYSYSAPPIRLKERPPFDSLSNGLILLLLFAIGHSFGSAAFTPKAYFLAATIAGIHAATTIIDYDADGKAKMRTFAIAFGKRTAAAFALLTGVMTIAFANLQSFAFNAYAYTFTAFSTAAVVYPRKRLLLLLFKIGYALSIAFAALFLYQQFYK